MCLVAPQLVSMVNSHILNFNVQYLHNVEETIIYYFNYNFIDPFTLQWAKWALNLFNIKVCYEISIRLNTRIIQFFLDFFFFKGEYAANGC